MSDRVPMSAEILAAHLRPMAAHGNPLAKAYLAVIDGAPNPEAAARAVEWSIGHLFDSLREILDALVPEQTSYRVDRGVIEGSDRGHGTIRRQ